MKRYFVPVAAILLAALFAFGCTKGYESQKASDDLMITISAASYPLIKGDNALSVKVADRSGKPVTDAAVKVRFFMPPMPGMAPMESSMPATLRGERYSFTANPQMEGGWKAEVTVTRPGKPDVTATFNLDAR